jgi:lipopolysaccharide/colanic/teichoic acid biosynthesis glycosyltransferase
MSEESIHIDHLSQRSLLYDGLKRLLDIVAGVLILIVCALPLVVIAVAVRCTSAGSIIYCQERVGRANRTFLVYKFRTMYADADRTGPLITSSDDCRVTPLGRFLRNTKLDELPQLFNVIRGEMSLVGPRPQVPRFVDQFQPEQRAIVLAVRPGITGPTQLKFRSEEQMLEGRIDRERYYIEHLLPVKCRLDVEYVQQRSLGRDLRVLWDTAVVVVSGLTRRLRHGHTRLQDEAVVCVGQQSREVAEEARESEETRAAR